MVLRNGKFEKVKKRYPVRESTLKIFSDAEELKTVMRVLYARALVRLLMAPFAEE